MYGSHCWSFSLFPKIVIQASFCDLDWYELTMIRNLQPHSHDPSQGKTPPLSSSGCVPCRNADPGYYNPNGQINDPLTMHALRQDFHDNRQS